MKQAPLVSAIIPTRNRPDELRQTLESLKTQTYRPIEVVVVDDASTDPPEVLVHSIWPEAVFLRHNVNVAQCRCRNDAFAAARGQYLLHLDDDASLTRPDDLWGAVRCMEAEPRLGVLAFYVFNGQVLPETGLPAASPRYTASFVGAGALMRKAAIDAAGGYREFFENDWEEEDLSIRVIDAGWRIQFFSDVVVHHRVSPQGRRSSRTWMRALRNKMWAMVMHMPARRMPLELAAKLAGGMWDAVRLLRPHRFLQAVWLFLLGLPRAMKLRRPVSELTLRRLDAMRFGVVHTAEEFADPPAITVREVLAWFRTCWWNRPRQRNVWDPRSGGVGSA
jgi:GT2 family glycosyltransferase